MSTNKEESASTSSSDTGLIQHLRGVALVAALRGCTRNMGICVEGDDGLL
jgi:hypothetical protein